MKPTDPLTLEWAKKVQKAFGPCTVLYGCLDDDDLLAQVMEGTMTCKSWYHLRVRIEAIHTEREAEALGRPLERLRLPTWNMLRRDDP